MNPQVLIDAIVRQTTVLIARLSTVEGVRSPLGHVANEVFFGLVEELENQGVSKKVIADMFGMALRTYHRRVRELSSSRTDVGRTLWESVLEFLREREATSWRQIQRRFRNDDPELLTGVLNDLVTSGIVYRTGRGDAALYRVAGELDFAASDEEDRREAAEYLTWLAVYRHGPIELERIAELSRLGTADVQMALRTLLADGRVRECRRQERVAYESKQFSVPLGSSQGWEAAVLDHFKAMVTAIGAKLSTATLRSHARDVVGGSTWSLDVWDGHPLADEALGTLARMRAAIEDLRQRVDAHGAARPEGAKMKRVVFYMGQYVAEDGDALDAARSLREYEKTETEDA